MVNKYLVQIVLMLSLLVPAIAGSCTTVFEETFDEASYTFPLPRTAAVSSNGTYAMIQSSPAVYNASDPNQWSSVNLTAAQLDILRGTQFKFSAYVKAANVAVPVNAWQGVIVQAIVTVGSTQTAYGCIRKSGSLWGDFGWETLQTVGTVPQNASSVTLLIGLASTHGANNTTPATLNVDNLLIQTIAQRPYRETFEGATSDFTFPVVVTSSPNGTHAMEVDAPASNPTHANYWQQVTLPSAKLEMMRGCPVRLSANVKSQNLGTPNAWQGITIQLFVTDANGNQTISGVHRLNNGTPYGTFDWEMMECNAFIPQNVQSVSMLVGLGNSNGADGINPAKVWIDDITIDAGGRGQSGWCENFDGPSYAQFITYGSNIARQSGTGVGSTYSLHATVPATGSNTSWSKIDLTPAQLALVKGSRMRGVGDIKFTNVSGGETFFVVTEGPHYQAIGANTFPGASTGTHDWQTLPFVISIPSDATAVYFMVGLQNAHGLNNSTSGDIYLDNLKLDFAVPARVRPTTPWTTPLYTGHPTGVPHLRGVNVVYNLAGDSTGPTMIKSWQANIARIQLSATTGPNTDNWAAYDTSLWGGMPTVDTMISQLNAKGIRSVISLAAVPGGLDSDDHSANPTGPWLNSDRIFEEQQYQDKTIEVWQRLAYHYKSVAGVWGYDLKNEPRDSAAACLFVSGTPWVSGWNDLAVRIAKAIRQIDSTHTIVVEPDTDGNSAGFTYLTPLPGVTGVVYSPHVYDDITYTHQYVGSAVGSTPPNIPMTPAATLTTFVQEARNFQTDYNVQMYVGEFSAARWAPNAATYLTNATNLFNSYGWDWSYHVFRGAYCWDLEEDDAIATNGSGQLDWQAPAPPNANTDRLVALKAGIAAP